MNKVIVLDNEINIKNFEEEDFISLTDMLNSKDGEFFISDWLRNRNTIEIQDYGRACIIKVKQG